MSGSRPATEMEGIDLRTKAAKRPGATVWETKSYRVAVLTRQLTGMNSGCPVGFPGTAYGDEKEVGMESVYSQP